MGGTSRKKKSSRSRDQHNDRPTSSSNRQSSNQRVPRDPSDNEKAPLIDQYSKESELVRAQHGRQKHKNNKRNNNISSSSDSNQSAQLGSFIGESNNKRRGGQDKSNNNYNPEHERLLDPTDSASVEFSLLTSPTAFMEDIDLNHTEDLQQRNGKRARNKAEEYNDMNNTNNNNNNNNNQRRRWFSKVKVNHFNSNSSTGGSSNGSSASRIRNNISNNGNGNNISSKFFVWYQIPFGNIYTTCP